MCVQLSGSESNLFCTVVKLVLGDAIYKITNTLLRVVALYKH